DYMIGEIYVPDVGIHIPILEGLTNENLWLASATMKPNQVMGEGNYAIAGHYMLDKSLLFTPLENSQEGQKVYITYKRTVYEYTKEYDIKEASDHLQQTFVGRTL